MALITRYFSTTSAGAADGTTWADRAALLDGSGNWSTIITGNNFTTDSMLAYIGTGTYIAGQSLAVTLFSNPPTLQNPLIFHGCDNTGAQLEPPDHHWTSAQPVWDTTDQPLINIGSNYFSLVASFRLVNISGDRNGYLALNISACDWCYWVSTSTGTSAYVCAVSNYTTNCVFRCTDGYIRIIASSSALFNCRLQGAGVGVGSGDRHGTSGAIIYDFVGCTICDCGGVGLYLETTTTSRRNCIQNCSIINNGSHGIYYNLTAGTPTSVSLFADNVITNNGGYGINMNGYIALAARNRLRDNTSGNFNGMGNLPETLGSDTSIRSGTSAALRNQAEFVDFANGDYRIRPESNLWGKNLGAGDAPDFQRFMQRLRG